MVGSWKLQELHPLLLPKDMKGMFAPVGNDRPFLPRVCSPKCSPCLPILKAKDVYEFRSRPFNFLPSMSAALHRSAGHPSYSTRSTGVDLRAEEREGKSKGQVAAGSGASGLGLW